MGKTKDSPIKNKKTKGSLSHFHDKEWFKEPSSSAFWIRIYSTLSIPWKYHPAVFKKALKSLEYDGIIKIYYGILSELEYPEIRTNILSAESGEPQINVHTSSQILPESTYIIFSTPFTIDGKTKSEFETKKRLDIAASVLNMHFGNNYLRDLWLEGPVNAKYSKLSISGSFFRLPASLEGPVLHPINWKQSHDIIKKISNLTSEKKEVIELALTLLERGIRDKTVTKFFYYWVSIEVLCGTSSTSNITKKLAEYYNATQKDVERNLHCDKFYQIRRDYFHRGKTPNFNPVQERYAQLLFLDLLRLELSLKNIGHLQNFLRTFGKDPFKELSKNEIQQKLNRKAKTVSKRQQGINRRKSDLLWEAFIKDAKL